MGGVINGFPTDVGSLLVMMGACSRDQVKHASERAEGHAVAVILLEDGAVTTDDVDEAKRLQDTLLSATTEVPVAALARLHEHAVANYHRSTRSLSERLEQMKR